MSSDHHLKTVKIKAHARTLIPNSFPVDQVRGMFDLPREKAASVSFDVELPANDEAWDIGVIVGPSGSGKSTVARKAYGKRFVTGFEWNPKAAIVDHFEDSSIKEVTQVLTSVGFSSPPSWIKPHQVLSGGEKFRCDLARALILSDGVVAFDEFTSVVDRTVAKIGSAAIAKAIRKKHVQTKFVAVTCHYDVLEWLEPDWVLDMASGQLARGSLRRPKINLSIAPVHRGAWDLFRRHHYLNTSIQVGARCFVVMWGNVPVAFSSWVHRMTRGKAGAMREHRTVVLPDFQGVGIGNRVSEVCASMWAALGRGVFSTTSHPAMIHYRHQSPNWRLVRFGMVDKPSRRGHIQTLPRARQTAGFQFTGPPMDREIAERLNAGAQLVRPIGSEFEAVMDALRSGGKSATALTRMTNLTRGRIETSLGSLERSGIIRVERVGRRKIWRL